MDIDNTKMSLTQLITYYDCFNVRFELDDDYKQLNFDLLVYLYRTIMGIIYEICHYNIINLQQIYMCSYAVFDIYFNIHFDEKMLPITIILQNFSNPISELVDLIKKKMEEQSVLLKFNLQKFKCDEYSIKEDQYGNINIEMKDIVFPIIKIIRTKI